MFSFAVRNVWDARCIEGLSADEVCRRMLSAAMVITYAGMRAMEAACLGVPSILIARNRGEALNAKGLQACLAGYWSEAWPYIGIADPFEAARQFLTPEKSWRLDVMSTAGRELVDGLGCQRVADAIEAL